MQSKSAFPPKRPLATGLFVTRGEKGPYPHKAFEKSQSTVDAPKPSRGISKILKRR